MCIVIFSHAVVVGNKKVYVTGCVGLSPVDGQLAPGGIEAETHQVYARVADIIGSDLLLVAFCTVHGILASSEEINLFTQLPNIHTL